MKCKGLCQAHYMQQYSGKPLTPLKPTPRRYAVGATCEFEGCERPVRSLGLCGAHHMQQYVGAELKPLLQRNKGHICKVDGCDLDAHKLRYCIGHYTQVRRGQDVRPLRKGGTGLTFSLNKYGYIEARVYPDHPLYQYAHEVRSARAGRARRNLYHRLVMADLLGRPLLRTETVHHKDGDRANNAVENLELRHGSHGQGQRIVCADCGSHNTEFMPLRQ